MEAECEDLAKHKLHQTQELLDLKEHELGMFLERVGRHKIDADLLFILRRHQAEVNSLRQLRDHFLTVTGEHNGGQIVDAITVAEVGGGDTGESSEAEFKRGGAVTGNVYQGEPA